MTNFLAQWGGIIAVINAIGLIFFVAATIWSRWSSGASGVEEKIVATYKTRIEQLESEQVRNIDRMHEHTKEIGQLQGRLAEKEAQVLQMRQLLENRNPELISVLQEIMGGFKEVKGFMVRINEHMEEHGRLMKEGMISVPQMVK